jgi:hypothetical protein
LFQTLVRTDSIVLDDRTLQVRYFEIRTLRGARRYSAEILLGPEDRIILDSDSLLNLEAQATTLAPATIYSHLLAARVTAA